MVLIGAITGGAAFAKEIKKQVTFSETVTVNGTPIKKGTYEAVFDDQTNELSIVRDRKVVAQAGARLEKREGRAVYVMRQNDAERGNAVLLSVAVNGNNQATIVNSGDSAQ
jgi:hypothetical protein